MVKSIGISLFGIAAPHALSFLARRRYPNVTFGYCAHANYCVFEGPNWANKGSALGHVRMGRGSYCAKECRISHCTIGRFCSIGAEVQIGWFTHPVKHVSTYPGFYSKVKHPLHYHTLDQFVEEPDVIMGNDVWIGDRAVIKSGVKIGDGAVIGAGALVTKDAESYSIMGGVPAKLIRKRFSDDIIKKLLALQWWNWTDEQLREMAPYFSDPQELFHRWNVWKNRPNQYFERAGVMG